VTAAVDEVGRRRAVAAGGCVAGHNGSCGQPAAVVGHWAGCGHVPAEVALCAGHRDLVLSAVAKAEWECSTCAAPVTLLRMDPVQ
jgi:hypothetical protein